MSDRTSERLLAVIKGQGPQTAAALAERLGVTPVAVRQMLDRLSAEGLVVHDDRREGVGRPKRHWSLTAAGHARFPDNHGGLTVELIDAARAVFGEAGLDRLVAHREAAGRAAYAARLAGAVDLGEKVGRLAAARAAEGYMAAVERDADGALLLVENHCPICTAAAACQGFCRSELAVFRAVLGPGARVERVDHILAGARRCAYRITPEA